jgi:hypothetical protein
VFVLLLPVVLREARLSQAAANERRMQVIVAE